MLCQDCQKEESTVHLTQIVNNKKVVLNLCKGCAENRGFHSPFENMPFPLAEFVTGMMGVGKKSGKSKTGKAFKTVSQCASCGLSVEDVGKFCRFGCGKCYTAFSEQLIDLLRKIHGSNEHRGKFPVGSADSMLPIKEERKLRDELKIAIEYEDFEKAAVLRDQINELSQN